MSSPEPGPRRLDRRDDVQLDGLDRAAIAARAADDKKGEQIVVLDVGAIISITEAFVLATGTNVRQVRTIVEEVERLLAAEAGVRPRSIEGLDDAHWVLMDYGDVVVHVFDTETRAYYDLERLWSDAPPVDWGARRPEPV